MKTANEQLDIFQVIAEETKSDTVVVNIKTNLGATQQPGYVYIGRGSDWGNPFKVIPHGEHTREEAIALYEAYIQTQPRLLELLPTLKGKTLGCYCKPLACHGDSLVKLLTEATK
jgi:hypothetical protein